MKDTEISADFPFESHFVEVHGSKIHYVDEGEGDPILFLHGNPTSSYLWRNIVPHVTPHARAITPDLIGMGQSDKPKLGYRFVDHSRYVDGFIEALDLQDITLVVHDWGSALGFHYAHRHHGNIKGIAFMESILRPAKWSEFPAEFRRGFKMFRTPVIGWLMISGANMFVNKILPQSIVRKLTDEEMAHYRRPYPTAASRKPLRQWPCEIPIDGEPADVTKIVASYGSWLEETELPKLFFYAKPGAIIPYNRAADITASLPNTRGVDIGRGIHFLQEDNPHLIGSELASWYQQLA